MLSGLVAPLLFGFLGLSHGRSIPLLPGSLVDKNGNIVTPNDTLEDPLLYKRAADPADFGWIKKWAAVGDSFTAGIGAGSPLSPARTELRRRSAEDDDDDATGENWRCSRYDRSYVKVLDRAFGDTDFHFVACSGDRTEDIYKQVQNMEGDLDLVIMTAGGNDLCLADMISKCVFFKNSEETCEAVIDIAQKNLESILKDNIKQVLEALNDKMKKNGIVIYNGYAQFFNTDKDDDCGGQDWTLWKPLGTALPLSLARRKKFNDLVVKINSLIKKVISEIADDSSIKYKIGFSNWDPWVYQGVNGQFCDPDSTGEYPEPDQGSLQFFEPETSTGESKSKRSLLDVRGPSSSVRDADMRTLLPPPPLTMEKIYSSSLMHSRSPTAVVRKKLDPRAPSPPGCPSDDDLVSIPVPDSIGKNFHPNEKGHVTIASFAVAELMDRRAEVLGVDAPECKAVDKFTCWQSKGSKAYASADQMNANFETFCNEDMKLVYRGASVGWIGSYVYHKGTPDEHAFSAQLSPDVDKSDQEAIRKECRESMDRIINSCDGDDPDNPMNWKFGGQWQRGDNYWEVTALADKRPWPPLKEPVGDCKGWWHGVWSSYEIYGGGWSSHDHGQKTLLPAAEWCAGESSLWEFDYLDEPTKEGYEWKANFNHIVFVRSRCYGNNKVAFKAGGFTDGYGGND